MPSNMMDLMNVKPGDAAKAATAAATPTRPPIEPLRSIDLNKEVKLGGDDDDNDTPAPTPKPAATPEKKPAEIKPAGEAGDEKEAVGEDGSDKKLDFDIPLGEDAENETTPTTQQTPADGEIPPGPRNYDDFPEDLRPILKALNNTQFAKHSAKLKEIYTKAAKVADLEKQLAENKSGPRFQFEHPESYRLTPEYNELEQAVNYGRNEISHWRSQLLAIEMGKPWKMLSGYDERTGEPKFTDMPAPEDGKIDVEAKIQVQEHLNTLRQQLGQVEARAGYLRDSYKSSAKKTADEMASISAKLFPKFPDDPAKLEGADKGWYDMTVAAMPVFSNHPLMRYIIGPMSVVANRLRVRNNTLRQEIKTLQAKLEDRKLVEPRFDTGGESTETSNKRFIRPKKGSPIDPNEEVRFDARD